MADNSSALSFLVLSLSSLKDPLKGEKENSKMAVPANISLIAEFQDNRGFRAITRINLFQGDISDIGTGSFFGNWSIFTLYTLAASGSGSILGALAAMSNSKVIKQAIQIDLNYAQEPSSETGTYQLVQDKAHLEFGDGRGGFSSLSVPAPKDGLFLTTADNNLVVVDPTSSLLTAFQTALAATTSQALIGLQTEGPLNKTARGGSYGSQFFGGQYLGKKSRTRRVLQGQ